MGTAEKLSEERVLTRTDGGHAVCPVRVRIKLREKARWIVN